MSIQKFRHERAAKKISIHSMRYNILANHLQLLNECIDNPLLHKVEYKKLRRRINSINEVLVIGRQI